MTKACGITFVMTFFALHLLPGCHLLVRLGEPAAEQKDVEEDLRSPTERPSAPSSGPETPTPPSPGLDDTPETPSKVYNMGSTTQNGAIEHRCSS